MEVFLNKLVTIPFAFWTVLCEMAPYLLFGFAVAGALSVFISADFVEKHLGKKRYSSVIKAAMFGVPLPLCSCGVIPVGASLRKHGASKGATTSFLISTPQTGVDSILVTFSLLGGVFAILRPLMAFVSGVVGGAIADLVDNDNEQVLDNKPQCTDSCCKAKPLGAGKKIFEAFHYGFVTLAGDISKALLVGLVIAALISALVPQQYLADWAGAGGGVWTRLLIYLLVMLVGIPIYVCATASVPMAAALIAAGVSPGAVFVFLVTGPATNAATIATIWKIMGKKTALVYILTVAVGAIIGGALLDGFFPQISTHVTHMMTHAEGIKWWGWVSAVVLLVVLGYGIVSAKVAGHGGEIGKSRTTMFEIKGMHCSRCAESIKKALLECPDVTNAEVNLKTGVARVETSGDIIAQATEAVESLGYEIKLKGNLDAQ